MSAEPMKLTGTHEGGALGCFCPICVVGDAMRQDEWDKTTISECVDALVEIGAQAEQEAAHFRDVLEAAWAARIEHPNCKAAMLAGAALGYVEGGPSAF